MCTCGQVGNWRQKHQRGKRVIPRYTCFPVSAIGPARSGLPASRPVSLLPWIWTRVLHDAMEKVAGEAPLSRLANPLPKHQVLYKLYLQPDALKKGKPTKLILILAEKWSSCQAGSRLSRSILWHVYICKGENERERQGVGRHLLQDKFRGALWPTSYLLREAQVVWVLNIFRHLKLGESPPILKKTMLISEVQALCSFHIWFSP